MISPARTAYVCSGDQLELTCNTTGQFLEWSFSFIPKTRTLSSLSQTDQTSHLVVNSTTFTFSRISGENSLPLISRLLVSHIEDTLNGTLVSCTDVASSETASTVIITIVDDLEIVRMHRKFQFELAIARIVRAKLASYTQSDMYHSFLILQSFLLDLSLKTMVTAVSQLHLNGVQKALSILFMSVLSHK